MGERTGGLSNSRGGAFRHRVCQPQRRSFHTASVNFGHWVYEPAIFAEIIEDYFPNVPKIELNRSGKARPGWDAWGAEAED